MIEKKIHYCWFGKEEMSPESQKYITGWKMLNPDYEIIQWNEDNFQIDYCQYAAEAYKSKKWAFVSDVARFYILYMYGGIYMDTDVELLQSLDSFLIEKAFSGFETRWNQVAGVAPGLILGGEAANPIFEECLSDYQSRHFIRSDGSLDLTTIVTIFTNILLKHGLQMKNEIQRMKNITIYSSDYFCPMDSISNKLKITSKTVSIHHYEATWWGKKERTIRWLNKLIGDKGIQWLVKLKRVLIR